MNVPVRYCIFCLKRCFFGKILVFFFCILILVFLNKIINIKYQIVRIDSLMHINKLRTTTLKTPVLIPPERVKQSTGNKTSNIMMKKNLIQRKIKRLREKVERLNKIVHVEVNETVPVTDKVHIFYYAWYENEAIDGNWQHWNHEYLKNWRKNNRRIYPTGRHVPPDDIGSNYYPKLGCYSSRDQTVVDLHMKQMHDVGIGVLIVSWYPPGMSDGPSQSSDTIFLQLLNAAEKYKLKISPHVEPYKNRNPYNLLQNLKYFTNTYGNHSALYRMKHKGKDSIVYYIYDSYRTPAAAWKELLAHDGNMTLRGTTEDGIFLGLLVDAEHKQEIKRARFDGFYTYFATNGFTYGSTWKNWKTLSSLARHQNLIFVPSIGPGYVDTRIRPWNSSNSRHRRHGKYYEVGWRAAISAGVTHISITSFNEWHEGTQIEPAVPKSIKNFTYLDYEPEGPDFYLNLTKFWINAFTKKSSTALIL